MSFFSTIYQSIYSKIFYRSLIDRSVSFSLSYFLAVVCVCGVFSALFFTALSAPSFIDFSKGISSTLETQVPGSFSLAISNGAFTTFPTAPITIEPSSRLKTFFDEHNFSGITHFLIIDSLATQDFAKDSHSLFVVSREHVFIASPESVAVYDVSEIPDGTFTASWARGVAQRISSYVRFIPLFFLLLFFVFFLGVGLVVLVQIFFLALALRFLLRIPFVVRIFGHNPVLDPVSWWDGHLSFALLYKAFLHASTLGFLFFFFVLLFLPQFVVSYIIIGLPISALTVLARLR